MTRRPFRSLEQLKAVALAALPDLLRRWLQDGEQRDDVYFARNPRRTDRNLGSFQINTRTGRWRDHAIAVGGKDIISLCAYLFHGDDYRAAMKTLARELELTIAGAAGKMPPPANFAVALRSAETKTAEARHIYATAVGLSGMPAATYLHSRGLTPNEAWDGLRASVQHYPGVGARPVLLAPFEMLDGSITAIHRTYLTPAGAKLPVPNPRRTLGPVRGAAIRLGQAGERLIICEGLEDGLTLFQNLDGEWPVWAAGGASFLPLMVIPGTVQELIIAADNDAAGERAAHSAADRFGVGERGVRIMRPSPGFKDFNDELRGIKSKESEND